MREHLRGYADAVLEDAAAAGTLGEVASGLAGFARLLETSEELRVVLTDGGVPAASRSAVAEELLADRVEGGVLRLVRQAVAAGRAGELAGDLAWIVTKAEAIRDDRRERSPVVLGRHGALERSGGYAGGVLEAIEDREVLSEVEDQLFRFERAVDASPELAEALISPVLPAEVRAGVVDDLLAGQALEPTRRLARYLTRVGRPRDFVELLQALVAHVGLEADRRIAIVRAVAALTAEQEDALAAVLSRVLGQQLEVRVTVDPTVLGGFVATIGDTMVDASVRHRLDSLRERLTSPGATTT